MERERVAAVELEAVEVADCALMDMAMWRLRAGGEGYVGVEFGGVGVMLAGGAPALMEGGEWEWGERGGRVVLGGGTELREGDVREGDVVGVSVVSDGWELDAGRVAEVELGFVPPVGEFVELYGVNFEKFGTGFNGSERPKVARKGECRVLLGGREIVVATAWVTNVLSKAFTLRPEAELVEELWADGGSRAVVYGVSGLKGLTYKEGCGVRVRGYAVSRVVNMVVTKVEVGS